MDEVGSLVNLVQTEKEKLEAAARRYEENLLVRAQKSWISWARGNGSRFWDPWVHVKNELIWARNKDEKYHNFQNIAFAIKERRNHVALVCQNISYDTSFWEKNDGTNFLDVPSKNLLLAIVPKVGCTNWKKVIMFLENKITQEQKSIALEKGNV